MLPAVPWDRPTALIGSNGVDQFPVGRFHAGNGAGPGDPRAEGAALPENQVFGGNGVSIRNPFFRGGGSVAFGRPVVGRGWFLWFCESEAGMPVQDVIDEVNRGLIERESEVMLMIVGAVSGQNVLFVGPPGTAKSLMVERLIKVLGVKGFVQLMHKHLPPEELIGPVELDAYKQGRYERVLTEMLPEAEVAFLDEIWKSAPAILNTLLRMLNEREFRNGTAGMIQCPLEFTIGASNEYPIGEGFETVGALFDRFLIRKTIKPVSPGSRRQLIYGGDLPVPQQLASMVELKSWQTDAAAIGWTDAAMDAYDDGLDTLQAEGVIVGDRRMKAAASVAQAAAFINGHDKVEVEDLEVLQHVLWSVPDQEQLTGQVIAKISNPMGWKVEEILASADSAIAAITDFTSPDAFAAAKKVKELTEELKKLDTNHPKVKSGLSYIGQQMRALSDKLVGV